MTKTIPLNVTLLEGDTIGEYIEEQIDKIAKKMSWAQYEWITNIVTDGKFLAIHASPSENYPGKSKPSKICYKVIALNDNNEEYRKLRKSLVFETNVHDELINRVEVEFAKYGTIKTWNMVYIPGGYALIVASI